MFCLGEMLLMGWFELDLFVIYVELLDFRSVLEWFNFRLLCGYREFGDYIICVLLCLGLNDVGFVMLSWLNGDGCRLGLFWCWCVGVVL